ncbi:hypothetical protein BDN72DRAFT_649229 [Pluteus cervinus]|uniref:Uncharacterized protein n=1 Tax=Pluteus cervinus TaxID=181527 RepID=A0ACD3AT39_9AGAR|nr:hypothetical protein BDN72DRAFT_649229 [Pluteus cervinus]
MLRRSFQALDLTHLQSLDISVENIEDLLFLWSRVFGPLPHLRTLRVRSAQCSQSFVNHLWDEAVEALAQKGSHNPKTFSALRTLRISDLDHSPPFTDIERLKGVLRHRSHFPLRLSKLVIIGPRLPDNIAAGFRSIIGEFITKESDTQDDEDSDEEESVVAGFSESLRR